MRLLKQLIILLIVLAAIGGGAFWILTIPSRMDASVAAALPEGDAIRGERIFNAGGCSSCHAASQASEDARLQLAGGLELKTPFGVFVAPNISTDPEDGIGDWTLEEFLNAMMPAGSPEGRQ